MSELDLLQKIEAVLRNSDGATAKQIAKLVKSTSSEVNSHLYRNKGLKFIVNSEMPPKWRSVDQPTKKVASTELLAKSVDEVAEINVLGSSWRIHLQVNNSSRNDPAFVVESLGARERIITVSVHALSDEVSLKKLSDGEFPDAVIVMASAAIVNEAIMDSGVLPEDEGIFAEAITDVLLQFSTAARSNKS